MGHHHNNSESNIKVAFFLNFGFTIIEFLGGFYTNSIAILSDAMHDLGDSISLGLAWYFQNISKKKRDKKFSYGYKRFSLLGALVNSFILLIGSVFILSEAIPRIQKPEVAHAEGMIYLAILGIIVNGLAVFRLKKGQTINEKVVALHLMEDVLGWVAVLIGAIIMKFYNLPIIDPLLSVGITLYVLFNIYKNLKETFKIVLQSVPSNVNIEEIKNYILYFEKVLSIHDLHVWSMDGDFNILTAHIVVSENMEFKTMENIKTEIRTSLLNRNIHHATLEFEYDEN